MILILGFFLSFFSNHCYEVKWGYHWLTCGWGERTMNDVGVFGHYYWYLICENEVEILDSMLYQGFGNYRLEETLYRGISG